ncbi:MAG: hypothetical protein KF868_20050 [Acidobacteria bacterium]|nr:hypothetical protein [Acidobacteriota bacterium]MCW5971627.1 hypothetical protein [Blastocatellales bacterium]
MKAVVIFCILVLSGNHSISPVKIPRTNVGNVGGIGNADRGEREFRQSSRPGRKPITQQTSPSEASGKREDPKAVESESVIQAIQNIEECIAGADQLDPVTRIIIRSEAADALWAYKEDLARSILLDDYRNVSSIKMAGQVAEQSDAYKGLSFDEIKAILEHRLMMILSSHDEEAAATLLEEKLKNSNGAADIQNTVKSELLRNARFLAATNPAASVRIIRSTLNSGFNSINSLALQALRRASPDEAGSIFTEALNAAAAAKDLTAIYSLGQYVASSGTDTGHYLADPQVSKDAGALVNAALSLLTTRLQTSDRSVLPVEALYQELLVWQGLRKFFRDILPDKTWMLDLWTNQVSAMLAEAERSPARSNAAKGPWEMLAKEEQRIKESEKVAENLDPQDKLKRLISRAENSTSEQQDILFAYAAIEAGQHGDIDQGMDLANKIRNDGLKQDTISVMMFRSGLKAIPKAGPDYALSQARQITVPMLRVRLYGIILRAFSDTKMTEREKQISDELVEWLGSREPNAETLAGLFTYLDYAGERNAARIFAVLDLLVETLGKAGLTPPANLLAREFYWHPLVHDYDKSFAHLIMLDYDGTLEAVRRIRDRESRLRMQVAVCKQYLRKQQARYSERKVS